MNYFRVKMTKKIRPDDNKTLYVGGIYEVDKTSGGSVTRTITYYPAARSSRLNRNQVTVKKSNVMPVSTAHDLTSCPSS